MGRKKKETNLKETEVQKLLEEEVDNKEDDGYSGVHIKLNDKYTLTSDKYQYILNKNGINRNTGEDTLTFIASCPTIEYAIKSIYEKELRTRTATNFAELFKNHKNIVDEIHEMFKLLTDIPNRSS